MSISRLFFFLGIALYLFLAAFNLSHFELWGQVNHLRGTNLVDLDPFSQAHFLRYALVLPIFILSDLFSLDADYIFGLVAVCLIYFITINVSYLIALSSNLTKKELEFIQLLLLIIISFIVAFMHGRILFAMCGFSLIVSRCLAWEVLVISYKRMLLLILIGLFLCTVSTGTFLVAVCFLTAWQFLSHKVKMRHRLPFLLFLIALSPLLILFVMKNIDFYGGGVSGAINMLTHGVGAIFYQYESVTLFLLLSIFMFILFFIALFFIVLKGQRIALIAISSAVFGGMFGLSTLSVGVPIFLGFVLSTIFDSRDKAHLTSSI